MPFPEARILYLKMKAKHIVLLKLPIVRPVHDLKIIDEQLGLANNRKKMSLASVVPPPPPFIFGSRWCSVLSGASYYGGVCVLVCTHTHTQRERGRWRCWVFLGKSLCLSDTGAAGSEKDPFAAETGQNESQTVLPRGTHPGGCSRTAGSVP